MDVILSSFDLKGKRMATLQNSKMYAGVKRKKMEVIRSDPILGDSGYILKIQPTAFLLNWPKNIKFGGRT